MQVFAVEICRVYSAKSPSAQGDFDDNAVHQDALGGHRHTDMQTGRRTNRQTYIYNIYNQESKHAHMPASTWVHLGLQTLTWISLMAEVTDYISIRTNTDMQANTFMHTSVYI